MSQPTARVAAAPVILRQLEAEMALFHDARRGDKRALRATKIGSGLPWPERLELAQPTGEHRGDLVQAAVRHGC